MVDSTAPAPKNRMRLRDILFPEGRDERMAGWLLSRTADGRREWRSIYGTVAETTAGAGWAAEFVCSALNVGVLTEQAKSLGAAKRAILSAYDRQFRKDSWGAQEIWDKFLRGDFLYPDIICGTSPEGDFIQTEYVSWKRASGADKWHMSSWRFVEFHHERRVVAIVGFVALAIFGVGVVLGARGVGDVHPGETKLVSNGKVCWLLTNGSRSRVSPVITNEGDVAVIEHGDELALSKIPGLAAVKMESCNDGGS